MCLGFVAAGSSPAFGSVNASGASPTLARSSRTSSIHDLSPRKVSAVDEWAELMFAERVSTVSAPSTSSTMEVDSVESQVDAIVNQVLVLPATSVIAPKSLASRRKNKPVMMSIVVPKDIKNEEDLTEERFSTDDLDTMFANAAISIKAGGCGTDVCIMPSGSPSRPLMMN